MLTNVIEMINNQKALIQHDTVMIIVEREREKGEKPYSHSL